MSSENLQAEAMTEGGQGNGDSHETDFSSEQNQGQAPTTGPTRLSREAIMQQAAASTLLQLHTRDTNNTASGDQDDQTYGNSSLNNRNMAQLPENTNRTSNAFMYSQINMQNTMAGLSNAIGMLQQEQLNMHARQENITGTLTQVLSVLQELKDGSSSTGERQMSTNNTQSERSTYLSSGTNRTTGRHYEFQNDDNSTQLSLHTHSSVDRQYGAPNDVSNTNLPLHSSSRADRHTGSIDDTNSRNRPLRISSSIERPLASQNGEHSANLPLHNSRSADRHTVTLNDANSRNIPLSSTSSIGGYYCPQTSEVEGDQGYWAHSEQADTYHGEVTDGYVTNQYSTGQGSWSSQSQNIDSQRYDSQCMYNERSRSRVTFDDAPGYVRNTEPIDDYRYEQTPGGNHSCSMGRTRYRSETDRNSEWYGLKIPPFNGKEDWKTWINRFEAIADRRRWDEESRLDNILPKLQGKAGDFVFSQLSKDTLSCYRELVTELNSRFRVVETEKSFAAKFSQRCQRADETVEEFAAELKRLYAKAYKNRDSKTKKEDLVRRFLDGMKDGEARFEIEYHKEPDDIDQAVYHAVNFIHTRRKNSHENNERRFKKYARRTNLEHADQSDEEDNFESDDEVNRAYRVPAKTDKNVAKKPNRSNQQGEQGKTDASGQSDSMKMITETRDLLQTLVSQLTKKESSNTGMKSQQQISTGFSSKGKIQCYACHELGHFARDCPTRSRQSDSNEGNRTDNIPWPNQSQGESGTNPLN